jgi:hypothetical protein
MVVLSSMMVSNDPCGGPSVMNEMRDMEMGVESVEGCSEDAVGSIVWLSLLFSIVRTAVVFF